MSKLKSLLKRLGKLQFKNPCFPGEIITHLERSRKASNHFPLFQTSKDIGFHEVMFGTPKQEIHEMLDNLKYFQSENYGDEIFEAFGDYYEEDSIPTRYYFIFHNNSLIQGEYITGLDVLPRNRVFGDVIFNKNYSRNLQERLNRFCRFYMNEEVPESTFSITDGRCSRILAFRYGIKQYISISADFSPALNKLLDSNEKCRRILSRKPVKGEADILIL